MRRLILQLHLRNLLRHLGFYSDGTSLANPLENANANQAKACGLRNLLIGFIVSHGADSKHFPYITDLLFRVLLAAIAKTVAYFWIGGLLYKLGTNHAPFNFDTFLRAMGTEPGTEPPVPLMFWTVPECSLSVICACLPTLRPVYNRLSPFRIFRSLRNRLTERSNSSNRQTYAAGSNDEMRASNAGLREQAAPPGSRATNDSFKSLDDLIPLGDLEKGSPEWSPSVAKDIELSHERG